MSAPPSPTCRLPRVVAACLAALASLPGLTLPFLSDDWAHLAMVERGVWLTSPFGYSRPLSALWFAFDRQVFGLSGPLFHVTNLVLITIAAVVVTSLVFRYTGDTLLALITGGLFALHPAHVECAAWVAARSDPLYSVLALLAVWAFERWRDRARGMPVMALMLFALALQAKEAAVVLPGFLLVVELCRSRPPRTVAILRGVLPMGAIALAHFTLIWSGGPRWTPLHIFSDLKSSHQLGVFANFLTSAVLPARTEFIEEHPRLWFLLAILAASALAALALHGARRIPWLVPIAGLGFAALLGPAIISFQDRFLFLPVAASCLGIAALLRAARPRARGAALALLLVVWIPCLVGRWRGWLDAGKESRLLIAALKEESLRPGTAGLFLVNVPHRVHGGPVFADLSSAVAMEGGRAISINYAALVDYPRPASEALAGPPDEAVTTSRAGVEVLLRVPRNPLSRLVWPPPDRREMAAGTARVTVEPPERVRVLIPPGSIETPIFVWSNGRLRRISE